MLERVEVDIYSPRDNHEMFGMFVQHLIDNKTESKLTITATSQYTYIYGVPVCVLI